MGRIQSALKRAESSRHQERLNRGSGLREIEVAYLDGDAKGFERRFRQHSILIGRGDQNDVPFDAFADPTVSAHHAEIRLEGDEVILYDMGSLNGCYIGALRVRRAVLDPESEIGLGQSGPRLRIRLGEYRDEPARPVPDRIPDSKKRPESLPDTAESPIQQQGKRTIWEPLLLLGLLIAVLADAAITLMRDL